MKNLSLLLLVVLIILNSCKNDTEDYVIKGTIKDGNGKKIYLGELTLKNIEPLDSIIIDENDEFAFNSKVDKPKFFMLRFSDSKFITLLIDSLDRIILNSDTLNFSTNYSVDGSVECGLIRELTLKNHFYKQKIDSLGKIFRENQENPKLDSIKAELDTVYYKIIDDYRNYSHDFINKNHDKFAGMMALYQQIGRITILSDEKDFEYFKKVDSSLMEKFPESKHVKALHSQIIMIKSKVESKKRGEQNVEIGAVAPEISLPSPEDDTISLSSLQGKYVLLDFWASWCKPCRMENPTLVAVYKKYHNNGFEIFQVSLDKTKEDWIKGIKNDNLNWIHVSDLMAWNSPVVKVYNVTGIPMNFLLDKEGKIIAKNLRGPALGEKLSEVLK